MTALDSVSLDTLSDSDAVSLLFDLTEQSGDAGDKLLQLDAVVHERLLRTYGCDDLPPLQRSAA